MNYSEIMLAINEVFLAQSDEELEAVLSRYPELLKEQTLIKLAEMAEQAKQNGQQKAYEELQTALDKILLINQSISNRQSSYVEFKSSWAIKVRQYLNLRNPELLEEAIALAKDEAEILSFLHAFKRDDVNVMNNLAENIIVHLQQFSRKEESLTIRLIYLDPRVALAVNFYRYPLAQQREAREIGIQACQEALQIAESLKDKPCQAFYFQSLASGFSSSQQLTEAEYFCIRALDVKKELAKTEPQTYKQEIANTLHNLGNIQLHQRKFSDAEISYSEALQIYRKLAITQPNNFKQFIGLTLNNLGITQREQDKLNDAEISILAALHIRRELTEIQPDIFTRDLADTLYQLGHIQRNQGNWVKSEISFTETLQIYQRLAETEPHVFNPGVAGTLNLLGIVQCDQRKLAEAETSHAKALQIYQELAENDPQIYMRDVAGTLNNLGIVQHDQRKLTEAASSHLKALQIYKRLAENNSQIHKPNVAATFDYLGGIQHDQGKLAEAESSHLKSLQIYQELAENEPHFFKKDLAKTLNNLGNDQFFQKKLADAEISYIQALQIKKELAENEPRIYLRDVARTVNNLGGLHREKGNLIKAEIFYNEALQIYRKLAETGTQSFNQDLVMTLNNIGFLQIITSIEKAVKAFENAKVLADNLREKAVSLDDKTRIMQENLGTYQGLLICYVKKQNWQKVLEIAELGKSRSLADLLNLKAEDLQPKSPIYDTLAIVKTLGKRYSEVLRELQQLESFERYLSQELNQIDGQKKQIEDNSSDDDETKLGFITQIDGRKQPLIQQKQEAEQRRFSLQSELKTVLAEINKYDKDFPPKAVAVKPEDIIGIAANLKRVIVMFRVLRESTAVIFVFPDGNLQIEEIPNFGQKELTDLYVEKWLKPYREAENDSESWMKAISEVLIEIDEKLIFKVREVLNDKTDAKDVLFIPNQSLALLPLHAACRLENGKAHYFLEDYNVSYCPSVSVFKRCQENEKLRSEKTLGIITPTKDLARFEKEQIEMIDNFNNDARKISNTAATKERVLEELKEDNGFIHFYCHGKYNEGNPFDSGLVLADDILKLSEIMNSDLRANWLTVLSACETGMVDAWSATDEHFGLPLGFVFAGSPSVWASLWSVSAVTTSDLMQKAYQNLKKEEYKNNKSEALRQAQLEMSQDKNFSHPFYWAGFQHFGV